MAKQPGETPREPEGEGWKEEGIRYEDMDAKPLAAELKAENEIVERGKEFGREFGVNLSDNIYFQDHMKRLEIIRAQIEKREGK